MTEAVSFHSFAPPWPGQVTYSHLTRVYSSSYAALPSPNAWPKPSYPWPKPSYSWPKRSASLPKPSDSWPKPSASLLKPSDSSLELIKLIKLPAKAIRLVIRIQPKDLFIVLICIPLPNVLVWLILQGAVCIHVAQAQGAISFTVPHLKQLPLLPNFSPRSLAANARHVQGLKCLQSTHVHEQLSHSRQRLQGEEELVGTDRKAALI
mmetsp:Transcript_19869/g.43239  ORF Transcript_19869/g.43239 Transcript_19869/m.43239 type:complete len:207 (+) Transcript_19869:239-859(+)